jgi:hypothetical protein
VEVGDFRAMGILAEQPEEDFKATVQNELKAAPGLNYKMARKTTKIERR